MIKYRLVLCSSFPRIEKCEFVSETNKMVVDKHNNRSLKIGSYICYFDTFEESKNHLLSFLKEEIKKTDQKIINLQKRRIEMESKFLEIFNEMIEEN